MSLKMEKQLTRQEIILETALLLQHINDNRKVTGTSTVLAGKDMGIYLTEALLHLQEAVIVQNAEPDDKNSVIHQLQAAGQLDPENAHYEADQIICNFLKDLGFADVVEAYKAIQPKWYA